MGFVDIPRGSPTIEKKYPPILDICSPAMIQIDPKTNNIYLDNDVPYFRSWGIFDTETDLFSLGYIAAPIISGTLSYVGINDMVRTPGEFVAKYNTEHPTQGGNGRNDEFYQGLIGQLLEYNINIDQLTRILTLNGIERNYEDNMNYANRNPEDNEE